jgi:hypothetical protein
MAFGRFGKMNAMNYYFRQMVVTVQHEAVSIF